jgi:hypothetical protein
MLNATSCRVYESYIHAGSDRAPPFEYMMVLSFAVGNRRLGNDDFGSNRVPRSDEKTTILIALIRSEQTRFQSS